MPQSKRYEEIEKPSRAPATTPEAKELELISLAVDLAAEQLRAGTASSQVITHYLKLGTSREQLEQEKLRHENELLIAKADSLASGQRVEELYQEAIMAMRRYSGMDEPNEEDEYGYDD